MKKKMLIVLMVLPLLVTFCGKSENPKAEKKVQAAAKEEIKKRVNELLGKADALSNEEKYHQALVNLREVVKFSVNFSQKFQEDMLNYKQYLLMKTGNFQEALDTAFQIEALSQKISKRKSPWKMACSFKGWSDETVKLYKINATPSTWLIDRKGFLRYYNLRREELRQAIEKVIKES